MNKNFRDLDTAHKYSDKMSIRVLQLNQLGNKEDAIKECVFTYKELTADEKARMQLEALDDYYRQLGDAEEWGLRKGMEQGRKETARILLSNVDNAMESFHVDLERACEGLGTTVEAYKAAQALME